MSEFHTNEHETVDSQADIFAPPEIGANTNIFCYNVIFQLSESVFLGIQIEDTVLAVDRPADALAVLPVDRDAVAST